MDHVTRPIDAIVGHLIPGVLFTMWGALWFRRARRGDGPFGGQGELLVIALAVCVGIAIEIGWRGWRLTDHSVMNYQHATMYLGFAVPPMMHALARQGRIPDRITYVTLSAALAIAGMLFIAHGNPNVVSEAVHVLMGLIFFGAALISACEACSRTSASLAVARSWLTIAVGLWFCTAAWVLGAAGYDLGATAVVLRVRLFFIWDLAGTGLVLIAMQIRPRPVIGVSAGP